MTAAAAIDEKAIATLRARLALAGHVLEPLDDGAFEVRAWGMSRRLADVAEVETFLRQVEAPAA